MVGFQLPLSERGLALAVKGNKVSAREPTGEAERSDVQGPPHWVIWAWMAGSDLIIVKNCRLCRRGLMREETGG